MQRISNDSEALEFRRQYILAPLCEDVYWSEAGFPDLACGDDYKAFPASARFGCSLILKIWPMPLVNISARVSRCRSDPLARMGAGLCETPERARLARNAYRCSPKLRGAKFFVDQNSAIIIVGAGSNRADAVIEPQ
jgi:hypothetical protein